MSNTRVLRGVILAAVLALVAALSGIVTSAAQAAYDTSQIPPPTKFDRSGADQDEYLVPTYTDSNGNTVIYQVNGDYPPSSLNSTGGASSVTVTTMYKDVDKGYYVNGPSWTLTYNLAVTASEAPNTFSASVGSCNRYSGLTDINLGVTNVGDASDRYLPGVTAQLVHLADGDIWGGTVPGSGTPMTGRVDDGQSAVLYRHDSQNNPIPFAGEPGTWTVRFFIGGQASPAYGTQNVFVPACGSNAVPSGDPSGLGGGTTVVKAKPRGMLRMANCRTGLVKGYTTTKGVRPFSGKTVFRYRKGKARPIVFAMRNNVANWKVKRFRHVPKGVVVKLWYKQGHKWILLAKVRSYRCRTDS